jgi:hypothetical protein
MPNDTKSWITRNMYDRCTKIKVTTVPVAWNLIPPSLQSSDLITSDFDLQTSKFNRGLMYLPAFTTLLNHLKTETVLFRQLPYASSAPFSFLGSAPPQTCVTYTWHISTPPVLHNGCNSRHLARWIGQSCCEPKNMFRLHTSCVMRIQANYKLR